MTMWLIKQQPSGEPLYTPLYPRPRGEEHALPRPGDFVIDPEITGDEDTPQLGVYRVTSVPEEVEA